MSFLDNFLNGRVNKEASDTVGHDAQDTFERKVKAHAWVNDILGLDEKQIEKEHLAALEAEAKALGKTAAHEFKSMEEVIESDYSRQVKSYSDSNLMEMLALARAYQDNVTMEKFAEYKEKAKVNVESSREKCEKELIELTGSHTLLDWKKAFDTFTKDAEVTQPTEKDLFEPKVTDKDADFSKPSEDKFKMPTKEEMVPAGNGREADQRTEVTKEAVPVIKEASQKKADYGTDYSGYTNRSTWGLSLWLDNDQALYDQSRAMAKEQPSNEALAAELAATYNGLLEEKGEEAMSSKEVNWNEVAQGLLDEEKESAAYEHSKSAPGVIESLPTMDVEQEKDKLINQLRTETDPEKMKALKRKYQHLTMASLKNHLKKQAEPMNPLKREELPMDKQGCPVCGSMGKDTGNGQIDHMACEGCGITYGEQEIKSCASKKEVIEKIAELNKVSEIQSPWSVEKLADGTEAIVRREIVSNEEKDLNKESDEHKDEEIQK